MTQQLQYFEIAFVAPVNESVDVDPEEKEFDVVVGVLVVLVLLAQIREQYLFERIEVEVVVLAVAAAAAAEHDADVEQAYEPSVVEVHVTVAWADWQIRQSHNFAVDGVADHRQRLHGLIVPVCAEDRMQHSVGVVAAAVAECAVLEIVKTESVVPMKAQTRERAVAAVQKVVHRLLIEKKVVHVPPMVVLGVWAPVLFVTAVVVALEIAYVVVLLELMVQRYACCNQLVAAGAAVLSDVAWAALAFAAVDRYGQELELEERALALAFGLERPVAVAVAAAPVLVVYAVAVSMRTLGQRL